MVTVSDIEGRLRVRDERLHDPSVAEAIRDALAASPEVYEVRGAARAGSLLVLYRHSKDVRNWILKRIGLHLQVHETVEAPASGSYRTVRVFPSIPAFAPIRPATKRKLTHIGMVSSLALSLLGAGFDWKALHVVSGALFILALGVHLSSKRRRLFA